ncbi:hypothetical protein PFISCL1PPCAC_12473, partial [Pristionchus fissidentatus]
GIFQTSHALMNSVDRFISLKPNILNFNAVVFEKLKIPGRQDTGERAGFDVHLFTHPENVPLHDLTQLQYRISGKVIVNTDFPIGWKDAECLYQINEGRLARITIPLRSKKDPVISYLADLIGSKTGKVIVTRIRNCDDFEIIRKVLKNSTIRSLAVWQSEYFNDEIGRQIASVICEKEV